MNDMCFYGADSPWVPTLLEIEANKKGEPDGSAVDWQKYGWSALYIDEFSYPNVTKRMSNLETRFNERYAYRMLNQETLEKWQTRLQNKFDECVARYERAYGLYEQYIGTINTRVLKGETTQTNQTVTNEGSDTTEVSGSDGNIGKTTFTDTPDSLINDSDDYAGSVTKQNYTQTYGKKNDRKLNSTIGANTIVTKTENGGVLIEGLNESIQNWMDIDTMFIKEFENNFMNVYWY